MIMPENKNSHRFFCNLECEYYPCHETEGKLNCLFCFCPLYRLGDNCPGNPEFIEKDDVRIKSCMNCTFPHDPDNYDKIMELLKAWPSQD